MLVDFFFEVLWHQSAKKDCEYKEEDVLSCAQSVYKSCIARLEGNQNTKESHASENLIPYYENHFVGLAAGFGMSVMTRFFEKIAFDRRKSTWDKKQSQSDDDVCHT